MIITTTPIIQGAEVKRYLGVVTTNEVLGVNALSEFVAAFSDGWGGRSGTFRRRFDELNQYVQAALAKKARGLGANAIIGYNIDFNEISGKNQAECY